jgi:hypothetical protein
LQSGDVRCSAAMSPSRYLPDIGHSDIFVQGPKAPKTPYHNQTLYLGDRFVSVLV